MTNTCTYNVHIYRELRLVFGGIAAGTPEAAANIARDKPTEEADSIDDCDGETLAALVDLAGDEEYKQSRFIDFESERLRQAAPSLLAACRMVTDRWERGDLAEAARACSADIADRIRKKAPHTLGKHISVQLAAIGLLDELTSGTTLSGLPYSFAEAADEAEAAKYTPGPWEVSGDRDDSDGLCVVQQATGGLICLVESTPGYAVADEANARLIAAAPAMLKALRLAQSALNTAPRFRVGETDSDKIAAIVDEAIEAATARREPL